MILHELTSMIDDMTQKYFDSGIITVGDGWDSNISYSTFEIFAVLHRNAKDLYVINDGSYKLFVKAYSKESTPTAEYWVYPGQIRCFHDVFRLLIAKTTIGSQYRVTEFKVVLNGYYR